MPEYIDRGVALDLVATEFGRGDRGLEKAYHEIFRYPAADVRESVKAYWWDIGSLSCRCSNCGCKNNKETMFCPNCGAHMEGTEDE